MALTVNTNIASLTAQRNLTSSQGDLSTSLQRLSSGLRINSAKDDAAGLAISERFSAQIRGINQGVRNANDGISLAQTAEGALKEVTSNLQRIRELAVQSANATNSTSDRAALQSEVAQLVAEIDRVAVNTKFNGNALLDGTFSSQAFQVGADVGETVTISSISSVRTSSLGSTNSSSATGNADVDTNAIDGTNVFINSTAIATSTADGVSTVGDTYSALSKATAINASTSTHGVTATAVNSQTIAAKDGADLAAANTDGTAVPASIADGEVLLNGTNLGAITIDAADNTVSAANIRDAVNAISGTTGVTASVDGAGNFTLSASDGRNIAFTLGGTGTDDDLFSLGLGNVDQTSKVYTGQLSLASTSTEGIQISATAGGASASNAILGMTSGNFAVSNSGSGVLLSVASVATVSGANNAITGVDNALNSINTIRADLGSYQNRFESVVSSSLTTAENLSASRSRIMDADFASETASLTKAQILQQSGIAMLAQANSIPQNVLALLQ